MFWCLFSSRFGFVALLIIFSFQTFSSFLGSLGNPQWQRMSKIMFTFIFVLGVFFFLVQEPTCHLYYGWAKSYSPGTGVTGVKLASQFHLLLKRMYIDTPPTLPHFFMINGLTKRFATPPALTHVIFLKYTHQQKTNKSK